MYEADFLISSRGQVKNRAKPKVFLIIKKIGKF